MLVFVVKLVVVMMVGPTVEMRMPHKPLVNKENKRLVPVVEVLPVEAGRVLEEEVEALLLQGLLFVDLVQRVVVLVNLMGIFFRPADYVCDVSRTLQHYVEENRLARVYAVEVEEPRRRLRLVVEAEGVPPLVYIATIVVAVSKPIAVVNTQMAL